MVYRFFYKKWIKIIMHNGAYKFCIVFMQIPIRIF